MRHVEYSTRPVTLQERIWVQRANQAGDAEAVLALIEARTDLTTEEALALDTDEAIELMKGIAVGIARSFTLADLQRQI